MKVLLIVALIVVVAGVALYQFGGLSSYDPTEAGREAIAKVSEGMTLEQVVEAIGDPQKYAEFIRETRKAGPERTENVKATPLMGFTLQNVRYRIDHDEVPEGLYLVYHYSAQASYQVHFDRTGVVTMIMDHPTMADLLQTRE